MFTDLRNHVLLTPFNRAILKFNAQAKAIPCFWHTINHSSYLRRFPLPFFAMFSLSGSMSMRGGNRRLTPEHRWRMNVGNWGTAPKSNGTGVFHWLHRLGRKLIWRCPRGGPMPATQPSKELRALCHEHHVKMRLNRSHVNSDGGAVRHD